MQWVNHPIVANKFFHLKYLEIYLCSCSGGFSPAYDYLSLVSFLDVSPVLETFILSVSYCSYCIDIKSMVEPLI